MPMPRNSNDPLSGAIRKRAGKESGFLMMDFPRTMELRKGEYDPNCRPGDEVEYTCYGRIKSMHDDGCCLIEIQKIEIEEYEEVEEEEEKIKEEDGNHSNGMPRPTP